MASSFIFGLALILMLFIKETPLATTIAGSGTDLGESATPDGQAVGDTTKPARPNALVTGLVLDLIITHWTRSGAPGDALTEQLGRLAGDHSGSLIERAQYTVDHLLRPAAIGLLAQAARDHAATPLAPPAASSPPAVI